MFGSMVENGKELIKR